MATQNPINASPTQYNVQSGGANGTLNNIAPSTSGFVLTSNGASSQPTFQAGGTGTVTSVSGTTNQISVATGTTTPVISLPSAITAPGSLTTTTTLTATTLFTASAGQVVARTATATSYSVLATDYIVAVTDTTAARTITFPSSVVVGQVWIVKDESGAASINNISLYAGGTTTIDGLTTQYLNTNYGAAVIYGGASGKYYIA